MFIFGGPRTDGGQRGSAGLLEAKGAPALEASNYNRDISFAFGAQPRLREAEKELLADLAQGAVPDGRGFTGRFITEYENTYQGILGEAPSVRASEIASALSINQRMRARDKALVFEAERRGAFFRQNLEDAIAAARDGVLEDPEGTEEIYSGLLDTLSLAADGWLGRDKGEELAGELRKELFESAAHSLIDQDPEDARRKLGQGIFGNNLGPEDRKRFADAADRRITSFTEDARTEDERNARAARLNAATARAHDLSAFVEMAEQGELTRTGLDSLLDQGRIDFLEHKGLSSVLAKREEDEESRHAAIERVETFLDTETGDGAPDDGGSFDLPDPKDVELWWQHVFAPSLEGLDPDSRAHRGDRMAAILGTVPVALAREIRAGLYSKNPAAIVAAAARVMANATISTSGRPSFTRREITVSSRITKAAEALPNPELAIQKFTHEQGIDREAGADVSDLLIAEEDDEDDLGFVEGTPDHPVAPGGEGTEGNEDIFEREDIDDETNRELGEIARRALNDAGAAVSDEDVLEREDIDDVTDQELGEILRRGLSEVQIDLTDFDAFADEDSDQKELYDYTAARRRRRKITGFGDLAAQMDRSLEEQENRPSVAEISRAQGQFLPFIGEIMAAIDFAEAVQRVKDARARGDAAAAREAEKDAAFAALRLVPGSLSKLLRAGAKLLKASTKIGRIRSGPLTHEHLKALEKRLRSLHGKRAPKRRETIGEFLKHRKLQGEVNDLRAARAQHAKGSAEYKRLLNVQRGKQLELNIGRSVAFDRTMKKFIRRKLGRKLRRMGFEVDMNVRRYVTKSGTTFDDGGINFMQSRKVQLEFKQGKAGKRPRQEKIQHEAAERDGMMRLFAPEGRNMEVTGKFDLPKIKRATERRNGNGL